MSCCDKKKKNKIKTTYISLVAPCETCIHDIPGKCCSKTRIAKITPKNKIFTCSEYKNK